MGVGTIRRQCMKQCDTDKMLSLGFQIDAVTGDDIAFGQWVASGQFERVGGV